MRGPRLGRAVSDTISTEMTTPPKSRNPLRIAAVLALALISFVAVSPSFSSTATTSSKRFLFRFTSLNVARAETDVRVLSGGDGDIALACMSSPRAARFKLPLVSWTRLRFTAASASLSASCGSSHFPLREAYRLFLNSDFVAPTDSQAQHRYLVSALPALFSDELMVVVDSALACPLAAASAAWSAATSAASSSGLRNVSMTASALRSYLCGVPSSQTAAVSFASLVLHNGLEYVSRTCGNAPARSADVLGASALKNTTSISSGSSSRSSSSSVWALLLDGVLPDGVPLLDAHPLQCDEALSLSDALQRLTTNYVASHSAPELAVLHHPDRLAMGIVNQVPPDPFNQNLPILHQNVAELAKAAASNKPAVLRSLLLPGSMGYTLPAALTAFNVMVTPLGVLQSLSPLLLDDDGLRMPMPDVSSVDACPPVLTALFEGAPPHPLSLNAEHRRQRYYEDAVGEADALRSLRARSPHVWFSPYWHEAAGPSLLEVDAPGSRTLIYDNIANPHGTEVIAQHTECDEWDAQFGSVSMRVVDEVIVLSVTVDSYYWFTVDVIGRLQLFAPYLAAHPRVVIHVPYWFARNWDDTHHARHWLAALGITRDRIVSGRIVGRIVHLPDRQPCGPRTHPLQLLGVQDASRARLSRHVRQQQQQQQQQRSPPPRNISLLVVQRAKSRKVIELDFSLSVLKRRIGKEVVARVFNPPALSPVTDSGEGADGHTLGDALLIWAEAAAVIAPHGAGLTNSLSLAAGSTLIEFTPQGHGPLGLYYFQIAHYARLRYHQFIASGTLASTVALDALAVVPVLCGRGGDGGEPPLACNAAAFSNLIRDPAEAVNDEIAPAAHAGVAAAAVAAPAAASAEEARVLVPAEWRPASAAVSSSACSGPITAAYPRDEPWEALQPYTAFNITITHPGASIPTVFWAWISRSDRLTLQQAEGVCLIMTGGGRPPRFIATDPSQRGLIRELEARRILPVAVPPFYADCDPARKLCYQNLTDGCENADLRGTAAFAGALLAAVRAARGLSASHSLPLYAAGLSSGAMLVGVLAAHMQIDAAIAQLEAPMPSLLGYLAGGSSGAAATTASADASRLNNDHACDLAAAPLGRSPLPPDVAQALRTQRPVRAPALWLTASHFNPFEGAAIRAFRQRWVAAGVPEDRLVVDTWLPPRLWPGDLHASAPWLFSDAAGRVVEGTLRAVGILVPNADADAALGTLRSPLCDDRAERQLRENHDWGHVGPLHIARGTLLKLRVEAALQIVQRGLRSALVFPARVPSPSEGGVPYLFASLDDPHFPAHDSRALSLDPVHHACRGHNYTRTTPPISEMGAPPPTHAAAFLPVPEAQCAAAFAVWDDIMGEWLPRLLSTTMVGWHEYHTAPWGNMADWITRFAAGGGVAAAAAKGA